jgi:hypothetical protein
MLLEAQTRRRAAQETQDAGIIALIGSAVRIRTRSGDDLTDTNDPFKIAMRRIAGVFAEREKARWKNQNARSPLEATTLPERSWRR